MTKLLVCLNGQKRTIQLFITAWLLNSGGMDRNGLEMSTALGKEQAVAITKLPHLKIDGIMTHYAVEDEKICS